VDEVRSFTLAPDPAGGTTLVAHRPDCPDVRAQAAAGEPVCTLMDCLVPMTRDQVPFHSCLDEDEDGLLPD